jgi:hypothetical protein
MEQQLDVSDDSRLPRAFTGTGDQEFLLVEEFLLNSWPPVDALGSG